MGGPVPGRADRLRRLRAAVAFEPIAVDGDSINRIADELNRHSDGMDLPVDPTPRLAAMARPGAAVPVDAVDSCSPRTGSWPAGGRPVVDVVIRCLPRTRSGASSADRRRRRRDRRRRSGSRSPRRIGSKRHGGRGDPSDVEPAPAPTDLRADRSGRGNSSVADELNRAAEGLAVASEAEPTMVRIETHPRRRDRLDERPDQHHDAEPFDAELPGRHEM